ncbi:MAG: hypothetical protein KKA19_07575 [Candidatus Margulisbacteria bacterium]|nr:hypothetical protein [Candidatus Margulisiibacteriota bacterium]
MKIKIFLLAFILIQFFSPVYSDNFHDQISGKVFSSKDKQTSNYYIWNLSGDYVGEIASPTFSESTKAVTVDISGRAFSINQKNGNKIERGVFTHYSPDSISPSTMNIQGCSYSSGKLTIQWTGGTDTESGILGYDILMLDNQNIWRLITENALPSEN